MNAHTDATLPTLLDGTLATGVRVPRVQRDYAQGRPDDEARRIRKDFVRVLGLAARGGPTVTLDFVFGSLADGGVLIPMDGQQRLTTVWLLHLYVASQSHVPAAARGFLRNFSYDTRFSAGNFCSSLAKLLEWPAQRPLAVALPDQAWFHTSWLHDPTVAGMLTMLDALARELEGADLAAAWARLVDRATSPIRFHLLPLTELGDPDAFYIRMNARGRPLTRFENTKAGLEEALGVRYPYWKDEVGRKFEGRWTELFWHYRADNAVDEPMRRYVLFVADSLARMAGKDREDQSDTEWLCDVLLGTGDDERLRAFVAAIDAWVGIDGGPSLVFGGRFGLPGNTAGKLSVFRSEAPDTDLLRSCTLAYRSHRSGEKYRAASGFRLTDELLLAAAAWQRSPGMIDQDLRLRWLRNLAEGSTIQAASMGAALCRAQDIVKHGLPAEAEPFSQRQLEEEEFKSAWVGEKKGRSPALHRLEEHPLVRGTAARFALDDQLPERVDTFYALFPVEECWPHPRVDTADPILHLALLAACAYEWRPRPGTCRFVDSSMRSWDDFLHAERGIDEDAGSGCPALMALLDRVRAGERSSDIVGAYLGEREVQGALDWRYYLVRYPGAWLSRKGRFAFGEGALHFPMYVLGYETRGAEKEDFFLSAVRSALDCDTEDLGRWGFRDRQLRDFELPWAPFPERWLSHVTARVHLRFEESAVRIRVAASSGGWDDIVHMIPVDENGMDRENRVELGVQLFREAVLRRSS